MELYRTDAPYSGNCCERRPGRTDATGSPLIFQSPRCDTRKVVLIKDKLSKTPIVWIKTFKDAIPLSCHFANLSIKRLSHARESVSCIVHFTHPSAICEGILMRVQIILPMIARILSISLVVLLFGMTFNAYACLIPLYSAGSTPMDCGSSDQPTREYCDVFKVLSVEHADHDLSWLDTQSTSLGETISVSLMCPSDCMALSRRSESESVGPPVEEVLAKLVVLRL